MTKLICKTKNCKAELYVGTTAALKLSHKDGKTAKSKLALPKAYENNGKKTNFKWKLSRYEQKDNAFSVMFSDEKAKFLYTVDVKARKDINGPVEYSAKLSNIGCDGVRVYPDTLFSLEFLFDKAPTSWRFPKESGVAEGVHWSKGKAYFEGPGIHKELMTNGKTVVCETNTCQDFNAGGMIPLTYIDSESFGAYVGFEWTSDRIILTGTENGVLASVDYREGFTTIVRSGDKLEVAPIYLGIYSGDVDMGSNEFKRWFFTEKIPKNVVNNENEPLAQIDPQIAPKDCAQFGIQSIKWDYGWWSNEKLPEEKDIWKFYEGSWKLRAEGMKNYIKSFGCDDLESYGKYMESLGLNWTLYILLHDSQRELEGDDLMTSVGENGHPEWFSDRKIAGKCPVADLGNEECVEYSKRKLAELFAKTHLKGWRTDFEPIANHSDKKNRHDANGNDVQYWCSKGFFDIVDYMIENVPGFRYECCCSGGGMKDLATLKRTTVFNTDDSADYVSLRTTFYDSSYCIPPCQLQNPVDPSTFSPESDKYAGIGDKDFGFRAMIMTGIMFSSWSGRDETGHLKYGLEDYYKEYINLHNEKIKHLIRHADLYHILPRPDNIHWDGVQYGTDKIPQNRICGATFIFKPTDEEGKTKKVPVRGLSEKTTYSVEFYQRKEQNFTATGKELMENGITVTINETLGSDIIFYVAK